MADSVIQTITSASSAISALSSTTAAIVRELDHLKAQLEAIKSAVTVSTGIRSLDIEEELDITKHALEEATIRAVSAEARMELLEKDLHHHIGTPKNRKPVRIYIDGCFDMMHFGHANAIRQASTVGDILVAGLISDEEVLINKGAPPLMPFHERLIALKACKWVDEVIEKAPYDLTREFCDELFTKYNIDYIVHGDDPCIAIDGTDAYKYPKSLGKFKTIKRTEGISTTDIVGRMLVRTNTHHVSFDAADTDFEPTTPKDINKIDAGISEFLPTTRRIMQFGNNKAPKPTDKIVYICGAFDLFNAGHIEALKRAKEFGDFLIVGVHTDKAVNQRRGAGFPILNLHERVLSVLQCRYADEVIIGAPWVITEDLIKSMNISLVVCGTVDESLASFSDEAAIAYAVPKKKGILQQFISPLTLTVDDIMQRIIRNRDRFETRFTAKKAKEEKYYTEKAFVQEL